MFEHNGIIVYKTNGLSFVKSFHEESRPRQTVFQCRTTVRVMGIFV